MAWNGSSDRARTPVAPQDNRGVGSKRHSSGSKRPWLRGLVAGVLVVAGGVVAWLLLGPWDGRRVRHEAREAKSLIKEVKPAVASPQEPVRVKMEAPSPKVQLWRGHKILSRTSVTNKSGYVMEQIACDNGKTYSHGHQLQEPPLFDNEVDNLLLQIAMRRPDSQMPPLPQFGNLDQVFQEAIKTPIIPLHTDSEEVRAKKRIVNELRIGLKETVESEGISVAEAIYRDHREFNENKKVRNAAIQELREIVKSGDAEGAQKYLETINAAFSNMGIDLIEMPVRQNTPNGRHIHE